MFTIETLAEIDEDGMLAARFQTSQPTGKRRVVIVVEDAGGDEPSRRLPDLSEFRAGLSCRTYPGNSVVDMRQEERQ